MTSRPDQYWETDAGQFLSGAHRYVTASRRLLRYEDWPAMQTPALHLLSQGIELLLKFPHIEGGTSPDTVRTAFGHDLRKLWTAPEADGLKRALHRSAITCWSRAKSSGRWRMADFDGDPGTSLEKAIEQLAHLHSRSSDFALRYILKQPEIAPKPRFVVDTFRSVTQRLVDDDTSLKL